MSVALDLVGGVGLFLLGIMLFMDSLRSIAGDAMRRGLLKYAGTPMRAFATGAITTSFIQSAHATMVIAMGLAGAGILTGAQSLAILIGANVGTTGTAWLVALLGLQVGFGPVATVLVTGGAFVRIMSRTRWAMWGQTVAGFGLLFVGIDLLATGMSGLDLGLGNITARGGVGAALALVGVGALTTILTQSSSVTVAATITAVFTGVVSLQDACWLVIGQNLGTTSTLALVSIGATAPGRRMALAHVVINGSTAVVVAIAFTPILWLVSTVIHGIGGGDALVVAGFHTVFNVVGAVIWMPLITFLTRRLERWVPDKGPRLTASLDPVTAQVPGIGVESARRTTAEIVSEVCGVVRSRLEHGSVPRGSQARLEHVGRAMLRLRDYLDKVHSTPEQGATHRMHIQVVHSVERLDHFIEESTQGTLNVEALRSGELGATYEGFSRVLRDAREWLQGDLTDRPGDLLDALGVLEARRHDDQDRLLEAAAMGAMVLPDALARLEATRWMTGQARSLHRIIRLLALPEGEVEGDGDGAPNGGVEPGGIPATA